MSVIIIQQHGRVWRIDSALSFEVSLILVRSQFPGCAVLKHWTP